MFCTFEGIRQGCQLGAARVGHVQSNFSGNDHRLPVLERVPKKMSPGCCFPNRGTRLESWGFPFRFGPFGPFPSFQGDLFAGSLGRSPALNSRGPVWPRSHRRRGDGDFRLRGRAPRGGVLQLLLPAGVGSGVLRLLRLGGGGGRGRKGRLRRTQIRGCGSAVGRRATDGEQGGG